MKKSVTYWAAGPSNATVLFSIGIVIAGTRNKTSITTTMQTHSVPTSDINPRRLHSLHWNTHGEHHANMLGVMSQGYHGDASCMLNPLILNSCSINNADHDQWAGLSYSSDHAHELQKEQILCNGDTSTHSAMEGKSVNSKLITSVVVYGSSNSVLSQGTWSESRQSSSVEGLFQEAAVNIFTQKSC